MGKPKPDNLETIKEAAILARRLVLNENRLATLQRCNAPEKIIAMEKERFWEFKEKIEANPLVTELLPQARKALAMENRQRHLSLAVTQKRPYVITSKPAIESDLRH